MKRIATLVCTLFVFSATTLPGQQGVEEASAIRDLLQNWESLRGPEMVEQSGRHFSEPFVYIAGGRTYLINRQAMAEYLDSAAIAKRMRDRPQAEQPAFQQGVHLDDLHVTLIDQSTGFARYTVQHMDNEDRLLTQWPAFVFLVKQADGWRMTLYASTPPEGLEQEVPRILGKYELQRRVVK